MVNFGIRMERVSKPQILIEKVGYGSISEYLREYLLIASALVLKLAMVF